MMKIGKVIKSYNREKQRDKKHYYDGSKKYSESDKMKWKDELEDAINKYRQTR